MQHMLVMPPTRCCQGWGSRQLGGRQEVHIAQHASPWLSQLKLYNQSVVMIQTL